jgi:hypothetical protein
MIQVGVKTYQNSNHGDAVGFSTFGFLEPTNTAVRPKEFIGKITSDDQSRA